MTGDVPNWVLLKWVGLEAANDGRYRITFGETSSNPTQEYPNLQSATEVAQGNIEYWRRKYEESSQGKYQFCVITSHFGVKLYGIKA